MRKPSENLDDHIVRADPAVRPPAPRTVSLRPTGELELLRPLTPLDIRGEPQSTSYKASRSNPLWFNRFLAVGSGALVIIAFALVSAILVGINDSATVPDIAASDEPIQTGEPFSGELYSSGTIPPASLGIEIIRSNPKRRLVRRKLHFVAAFKPKSQPQLRTLPQPEQPKFVPTTLVIYAENGVINTRIEPWLQFSN